MPEMHFHIRWPDGSKDICYSPSLVIEEHLQQGQTYPLQEFVARVYTALNIASERVQAKYGFPCSRAQGQLARIEHVAHGHADVAGAEVTVERFERATD